MIRCKRLNLLNGNLIVAGYLDFLPKLPEVLHQVVRKGIVIIDNQDHNVAPPSAPPVARDSCWYSLQRTAFTTALALLWHSRYSRYGSESITIPAPVWM
ncbi:hypothetical protein D3C81_2035740 [compost metagenome]